MRKVNESPLRIRLLKGLFFLSMLGVQTWAHAQWGGFDSEEAGAVGNDTQVLNSGGAGGWGAGDDGGVIGGADLDEAVFGVPVIDARRKT